jgi:hypothetical protein
MLQIKHYETLETFNNDKNNLETPYIAYIEENSTIYYSVDDVIKYRVFLVKQKDISNITYETVDLGLPSGLKWADRNVGATSPGDYGSYFQWGDTNPYTFDGEGEITAAKLAETLNPLLNPELGEEITADNVDDILLMLFEGYDVGNDLINTPAGSLGFSLDKSFNWESYNEVDEIISWEEDSDGYIYPGSFKKYNNSDNSLTQLESVDDAATVHMGSQYRMPTIDEINELIENTIQTFIDIDGNEYIKGTDDINIEQGKLKGVRFTGSNGNSVFIPAAGECDESLLGGIGTDCLLWSSSLYDGVDDIARGLGFYYDGLVNEDGYVRYFGLPIRGVLKQ